MILREEAIIYGFEISTIGSFNLSIRNFHVSIFTIGSLVVLPQQYHFFLFTLCMFLYVHCVHWQDGYKSCWSYLAKQDKIDCLPYSW